MPYSEDQKNAMLKAAAEATPPEEVEAFLRTMVSLGKTALPEALRDDIHVGHILRAVAMMFAGFSARFTVDLLSAMEDRFAPSRKAEEELLQFMLGGLKDAKVDAGPL